MATLPEALEALRKSIILDCEETLANPKNGFTEASLKDACSCYNNLKVVLRILKTDRSATERYLGNIEHHILNKPCKHTWNRERMNAAAWDYVDAKTD
jgi:hypothetical protein